MAKCHECSKVPAFGYAVSHSKRHTTRMWKPNIRKATLLIDGKPQRVTICARCLKSYYKAAV